MPEEEKPLICKDEHLRESLAKSALELASALERQLKEQGKRGLPVEEGLKAARKAKRYIRQVLRR